MATLLRPCAVSQSFPVKARCQAGLAPALRRAIGQLTSRQIDTPCEMHAYERHAYEKHVYERHALLEAQPERHAHKRHACEMNAYERYVYVRYTL
jgi:hypothetical protein